MSPVIRRAASVAALLFVSARAGARADDSAHALDGPVLDRAAFVHAVLDHNPTVEAARQSVRAAKARVRQVGAFDDPMIEVGLAPLSIGASDGPLGYELGISQALPWFGKRGAQRPALEAEAAAAELDVETARRALAMAAVELYGRYFVAARSLEINAQHAELVRALRDTMTAQLQAGRGMPGDVLAAESELAELERAALGLAADRDIARAQMNELLHREPSAQLPPPPAQLAGAAAWSERDARELERAAIDARSDIAATRMRARAESAKADAAGREYWPTITLSTSYSSMWEMAEHRWMIGAAMNVPLPTGQRVAAVDEARAMRAQYEREAERMTDMARAEVFVALRRLEESDRLLQHFETRLLPVARERAATLQASFAASQASVADVLEAERSLRGTSLEHQLVQAERDQRIAGLALAAGKIPGLGGDGGAP